MKVIALIGTTDKSRNAMISRGAEGHDYLSSLTRVPRVK